MHNKRMLAGLILAAMTVGCSALPHTLGAADADNPPAYVNVIQTEEIRIQLLPQDSATARPNDHPAAFEPGQLAALLTSLRLRADDGTEQTITSPSRLQRLAADLSKAFVRAGPRQDIAFVVFRRASKGLLSGSERHVTTGRAFYRDQTLNIIFGDLDSTFSEFRDLSINPFKYGDRATARPVDGAHLVGTPTWRWHGDRHDWIEMAATPEAIHNARNAAPQVIESGASSAARPLEYGPAAAPAAAGTLRHAPTPAAQAMTPQPASASGPAAIPTRSQPATTSEAWSRIEERLTQLKRLRDKDLITDEDYKNKKDALLRQLP